MGLVFGPVLALALWYFKRSQSQMDKQLDHLSKSLEEVRDMLAVKVERSDIERVWEHIRLQDQDIKNLGAAFSREMREQIDGLRREQKEDWRQVQDRLDRILGAMTKREN